MPLSPLPPTSNFVTTGETKATFKGALSALRAYLNSLLGASGSQADALTALGSLLNGTLAKSSAYMVVAADRGKGIDCSGTWVLAIDAVATLAPSGAGFAFAVFNPGTGVITINPNLSEQINAASTFILGPGESCVVMVNAAGDGWLAVLTGGGGGVLAETKLTSGTSHTLNAKTTHVIVEAVGGGGGGAGGATVRGSSGGSGSYFRTNFLDTASVSSLTYEVGAGGTAGLGNPTSGGNGGNSAVTVNGTTFTAYGGGGGAAEPGASESGAAGLGGVVDTNTSSRFALTGSSGNKSTGATAPGGESAFSIVALANVGTHGGGGSGSNGSGGVAGYAGGAGMLIITEYKL